MQDAITNHFHTFSILLNNSMDIYMISTLKMSQLWYKAVNKLPNPSSWSVKIQLAV